jgi:hypothetical protein
MFLLFRFRTSRSLMALLVCAAAYLISPQFSRAGDRASEFPPLSQQKHYRPATLGSHDYLQVEFPGGAASRGNEAGYAMVSVLIDAKGDAIEFFTVGYTDRAFGKALSDKGTTFKYVPAKYNGVNVPSRFNLQYTFKNGNSESSSMDVAGRGVGLFGGAVQQSLLYSAVTEDALDKPLEFTDVSLPRVPVDFKIRDDQPLRVYVSFYVDETGHVHVPNVESAAAPELIAPAIKAVRLWTFQPPLSKGKPALVFAARPVVFVPRNKLLAPAANSSAPTPASTKP